MTSLAFAWILAQPPVVPKLYPPDAATRTRITALQAELDDRLSKLVTTSSVQHYRPDALVYAKAAEWVVRHHEWYSKDSAAQTVRVLQAGIERVKELAAGRAPWRQTTGRPVILGFVSSVDGSIQPVAVTRPQGGVASPDWQCDVVLHGRDNTLTEVKFIAQREAAKSSQSQRLVIEPFGRGNNAYRWAGETDVFEAIAVAGNPDPRRTVLRGFSMGGAGVWHLGLHHPTRWAAIQPGAGFTTTHGYIRLSNDQPDQIEKCLTIYDADRYAENIYNLPTVAYSGEKDKQKAAADGIKRAIKGFPGSLRFTHLVAPGLEHRQPADWVAKCDVELAKHLPRTDGERVRFVTYTPRYGNAGSVQVEALERQYQPAVVESIQTEMSLVVKTKNVRRLKPNRSVQSLVIDGQTLPRPKQLNSSESYQRINNTWVEHRGGAIKSAGQCGPIDDAFMNTFVVVPPTKSGWHPATGKLATAAFSRFATEWDRYLRGKLPTGNPTQGANLVLFGDPSSNPHIKQLLSSMPITWTREELVVNGVRYDAATHLPVLIYPLSPSAGYVVLNSGHTFGEREFQGSNAQLYPRLGDWAVRKVSGEVVAAGLFDENWQFRKQ